MTKLKIASMIWIGIDGDVSEKKRSFVVENEMTASIPEAEVWNVEEGRPPRVPPQKVPFEDDLTQKTAAA